MKIFFFISLSIFYIPFPLLIPLSQTSYRGGSIMIDFYPWEKEKKKGLCIYSELHSCSHQSEEES